MKCCGEIIRNTALGKDFYVCRGCKKEVTEEPLKQEVFVATGTWIIPKDSKDIFVSFASSYGKSVKADACRCADNFLCNYCYYASVGVESITTFGFGENK